VRVVAQPGIALERVADQKAADEEEHRHARKEIRDDVQRPLPPGDAEQIGRVRHGDLQRGSETDQVEIIRLRHRLGRRARACLTASSLPSGSDRHPTQQRPTGNAPIEPPQALVPARVLLLNPAQIGRRYQQTQPAKALELNSRANDR